MGDFPGDFGASACRERPTASVSAERNPETPKLTQEARKAKGSTRSIQEGATEEEVRVALELRVSIGSVANRYSYLSTSAGSPSK